MPQIRQDAPLNDRVIEWESLPQPTVAYGRDLASGQTLAFHSHRRAQFVYASEGVMSVTTDDAAYVVPPQQALWLPGGVRHQIDARSDLAMRTLYVEAQAHRDLPKRVRVLAVTPLLRELVLAAVNAGPVYAPDTEQARLALVILDQICAQPSAPLALPMPTDSRLARITHGLLADPGDRRDLSEWADVTGASRRNLGRLFRAQTGLSFREWRQQCRVLRALELLARGDSVTNIAMDLGYDNTSAFIAMFRRYLGTTPARYLR